MDYSEIMDFLYSTPMPVADHFMAFDSSSSSSSSSTVSSEAARTLHGGEVCELCYAYFAHDAGGKAELWRHVRNEHDTDRRLKCPVPGCGRRFIARSMSAAHSDHHGRAQSTDDRPFTCELCGHLSSNGHAFDKHMARAHAETLDALCGVCRLYVGDVPSLIDHVRRRHGDQKTVDGHDAEGDATCTGHNSRRCIRCDVCGKRYGNNRNMYKHRLVHQGGDSGDGEQSYSDAVVFHTLS